MYPVHQGERDESCVMDSRRRDGVAIRDGTGKFSKGPGNGNRLRKRWGFPEGAAPAPGYFAPGVWILSFGGGCTGIGGI